MTTRVCRSAATISGCKLRCRRSCRSGRSHPALAFGSPRWCSRRPGRSARRRQSTPGRCNRHLPTPRGTDRHRCLRWERIVYPDGGNPARWKIRRGCGGRSLPLGARDGAGEADGGGDIRCILRRDHMRARRRSPGVQPAGVLRQTGPIADVEEISTHLRTVGLWRSDRHTCLRLAQSASVGHPGMPGSTNSSRSLSRQGRQAQWQHLAR